MEVVTVGGLEPGELLRFRSASHAVDVTADRDGVALVPVVLRGTVAGEQAVLERVSRRPLREVADVRTAWFTLEPTGAEASLNPQPLPPKEDPVAPADPRLRREVEAVRADLGIPDIVDVLRLPGLEDAQVRVARLADGAGLVIDLRDGVRVSGTFDGALGRVGDGRSPVPGTGLVLTQAGSSVNFTAGIRAEPRLIELEQATRRRAVPSTIL